MNIRNYLYRYKYSRLFIALASALAPKESASAIDIPKNYFFSFYTLASAVALALAI
jgi:hypothetical protein